MAKKRKLIKIRDLPKKQPRQKPPQIIQVELPAGISTGMTSPKKTTKYKRGKYRKTTTPRRDILFSEKQKTIPLGRGSLVKIRQEAVRKQVVIPSAPSFIGTSSKMAYGGTKKATKFGWKYIVKPLGKGTKSYGKTQYRERTKFGFGGKKGTVQIKKITAEKEEAKARKDIQEYKDAQRKASQDRRKQDKQKRQQDKEIKLKGES